MPPVQPLLDAVFRCLQAASITSGFLHASPAPSSPPIDAASLDVDVGSWGQERAPSALEAAALVAKSSSLLSHKPQLKLAFWSAIFKSPLFVNSSPRDRGDHESPLPVKFESWMIESARFPVIELNFFRVPADDALIERLGRFLTVDPLPGRQRSDPALHSCLASIQNAETASGVVTIPPKARIALHLTNRLVDTRLLEKLRGLLDRVTADPNLQFTVCRLDLSGNKMSASDLASAAEIPKKSHIVYCIEELVLTNALSRRTATPPAVTRDQERKSMQSFIQSLFGAPQSSPSMPRTWSVLRRVTFDNMALGVEHFAAICSTLRYGCTIKELSLASVMRGLEEQERRKCWQWLGFALFCPRLPVGVGVGGSAFANSSLCTIDLSGNEFDWPELQGFMAVMLSLQNLAVQFLGAKYGLPHEKCPSAGEFLWTCTASDGARIYSESETTAPVIAVLDQDEELEVHHQRLDGWLWILVSGIGFGWIPDVHVANLQRYPLKDCETRKGQYNLIMNKPESSSVESMSNINSLVRTVGDQLKSLQLRGQKDVSTETIVKFCEKLEHLDLEGATVKLSPLLKGMRQQFGSRLKSLDLNKTDMTNHHLAELSWIISSKRDTLALEDLRLSANWGALEGLGVLFDALGKNKTLAYLELEMPRDDIWNRTRRIICQRIDEAYQNELLRFAPMPLKCKLAVLSIATSALQDADDSSNSSSTAPSKALGKMDTCVLSLIFQFARIEVRRKIAWIPELTR